MIKERIESQVRKDIATDWNDRFISEGKILNSSQSKSRRIQSPLKNIYQKVQISSTSVKVNISAKMRLASHLAEACRSSAGRLEACESKWHRAYPCPGRPCGWSCSPLRTTKSRWSACKWEWIHDDTIEYLRSTSALMVSTCMTVITNLLKSRAFWKWAKEDVVRMSYQNAKFRALSVHCHIIDLGKSCQVQN